MSTRTVTRKVWISGGGNRLFRSSFALSVRLFTGLLLVGLLLSPDALGWTSSFGSGSPPLADKQYIDNQVIIKFAAGAKSDQQAQIRSQMGATTLKNLNMIGAELLQVKDMTVEEAVLQFKNDPLVEYIEPNYLLHVDNIPNDPYFNQLWGMNNTGQSGGAADADIDAPEAWDVNTGGQVIVGVIDTGVDTAHVDLRGNLWTNPGEIPNNGIDDDSNGYVDDYYGWDFVNGDNLPLDDNGHGSHTSGTIAAVGNNGIGVVGVCWSARIMALKVFDSGGSGNSADAALALEYAIRMGARLTSNSWGGGPASAALQEAIDSADAHGMLFVASAGNAGNDNDLNPVYPCSYPSPSIISVAATDHNDLLASFSNYGATTVDLGAPGVDVYSTFPGNSYYLASGTSMSAPHVSGVAALIWSTYPSLTNAQVKARILNMADPIPSLAGKCVSGGRLNAFYALAQPDSVPPAPVVDLTVSLIQSTRVTLTWTAPGDDSSSGTASSYDIRWSMSPIDNGNFAAATKVPNQLRPQSAGSPESFVVRGLTFSTTYYFAVKAADEWGNSSDVSNSPAATTLGPPQIKVTPDLLADSLFSNGTSTQQFTINNSAEGELQYEVRVEYPSAKRATGSIVIPPASTTVSGEAAKGKGNRPASGELRFDITGERLATKGKRVLLIYADNGAYSLSSILQGYPDMTVVDAWAASSNGGSIPTLSVLKNYDVVVAWNNAPWADVTEIGNVLADYMDQGGAVVTMVDCWGAGSWVSHGRYFDSDGYCPFRSLGDAVFQSRTLGWYDAGHPIMDGVATLSIYDFYNNVALTSGATEVARWDDGTPLVATNRRTVSINVWPGDYQVWSGDFPTLIHNAINCAASGMAWLSVAPDSGEVVPFGSEVLNAEVNADGLDGGDYLANILIYSNDPADSEVTVPFQLNVTGAPDIAVESDSLDFGESFIGHQKQLPLLLSNKGTDILIISSFATDLPEFAVDASALSLAPHKDTTLMVSFLPGSPVYFAGVLTIASNDPDNPTLQVYLEGTGLEPPEIAVTPLSVGDTLFTGGKSTRPLTIANNGGSALHFEIQIEPVEELAKLAAVAVQGITAGGTIVTDGHTLPGFTEAETVQFEANLTRFHQQADAIKGAMDLPRIAVVGSDAPYMLYELMQDFSLVTRYLFSAVPYYEDFASIKDYDGLVISEYDAYITEAQAASISAFTQTRKPVILGMDDLDDEPLAVRNLLYPVFGISEASDGVFYFGSLNRANPITEGIDQVFSYADSDNDWFVSNGADWIYSGSDGNHYAMSYQGTARTVVMGEWLRYIWDVGNQRLIANAIDWMMGGAGWLKVEPRAGTVEAGASIDVQAQFNAFRLSGGEYHSNLVISSNDPATPQLQIPAFLQVTGAADISVSRDSLLFDSVYVTAARTDSVAISNDGVEILTITAIAIDNPVFSAPSTGFSLSPGEKTILPVTFAPTSSGLAQGLLVVSSDDPDEGTKTVILEGIGVEPPDIAVTPDSLSDSLLSGETSTKTMTISNTGKTDLRFSITTADGAKIKSIVTSGKTGASSGAPVIVGESRSQLVPVSLTGRASEAADPTRVTISRSSTSPSPYEVDWNTVPQTKGARSVTVPYTDGFESGNYDGWYDDGGYGTKEVTNSTAAVGNYSFHYNNQTGGHMHGIHQEFTPGSQPDYAGFYVRCGSTSQAAGYFVLFSSQYYDAIFFYADKHGRFYVNDYNTGDNSFAYQALRWYHVEFKEINWSTKMFDYYVDGQLIKAGIPFRYPDYVTDFSRLYLYNFDYASDAWWDQIQVGATPWLEVSPMVGVIPAGSSMEVTITFDTDRLLGGDYFGNIVISSNDPSTAQVTVPAHLHITGAPDIVLSSDSLDYGAVYIGASATDSLGVKNDGTDTLKIGSVSLDGLDFTADTAAFNLSPGETRKLAITFAPTSAGLIAGTLTVNSNDPNDSVLVIPLTGEGLLPPDIRVSPDSFSFTINDGDSAEATMTIANVGPGNLNYRLVTHNVTTVLATKPAVSTTRLGEPAPGVRSDQRPADYNADNLLEVKSSSVFGEATVLLIEDVAPWGLLSNEIILENNGIAFDRIYSSSIDATDFSRYRVIIVPSVQTQYYYDQIAARKAKFDSFVAGGGVLEFHAASFGYGQMPTLPGGMTINFALSNYNYVLDYGHPLVQGVSSPFYGSSASHANFSNIPAGASLIVEDEGQIPNLVEYRFGAGLVIASGQTLEFGYGRGQSAGIILENMIPYSVSGAQVSWLTLTPTEGSVAPGDSATIQLKVKFDQPTSGIFNAVVEAGSNDPDQPVVMTPVTLHVIGVPRILVSVDSLSFGPVYIGAVHAETLTVSNPGTDLLEVTSIASDDPRYLPSDTGFTLGMSESRQLVVTFQPNTSGPINGHLSLRSNDPDDSLVVVALQGIGVEPPDIAVTPGELRDSLFTGQTSTQTLSIANNGVTDLIWRAVIQSVGKGAVVQSSPRFSSTHVELVKPETPSGPTGRPDAGEIYSFEPRGEAEGAASSTEKTVNSLEKLLENLNAGYQDVSNIIPQRYDFTDGEVGYEIWDGGNDMYDGGNYLGTNFGGPLAYSNNNVAASSYFGTDGKYFTSKYPGLFVMVADMQGVYHFEITGDLGADGGGSVDGVVLTTEINGTRFLGFVKRVYNTYDPSVNHLIIVEDDPAITHEFSTNTNDDYHRVLNLTECKRIYYLLYAGAHGYYVDDNATLAIMNAFLNSLKLAPEFVTINPAADTVSAGSQSDVAVTFNAAGLNGGEYGANIVIFSNDPDEAELTVPAFLHVTGTPDILVSVDSLSFGPVYIGALAAETLTVSNVGTDILEVKSIVSDDPHYLPSDTGFTLGINESRQVVVTFQPNTSGLINGLLSLRSNDPDDSVLVIPLTGEGLFPPDIRVSPDSFSFTIDNGDSAEATMTIANTGLSNLNYRLVTRNAATVLATRPVVSAKRLGEPAPGVRSDQRPADYNADNLLEVKSSSVFGEATVLLIEDVAPWGLLSNEIILENNGIAFDRIYSSSIDATDFSRYRVIIVPSDQTQDYYDIVAARKAKFDSFVAAGGVLEFHAAFWGWNGGSPTAVTLPGGMTINGAYSEANYVLIYGHPLVQGVPSPFYGSLANFSNIPAGASLIVEDEGQVPNLVEYRFGSGLVIASGQTLEWGYYNGQGAGIILENMIPYSVSGAQVSWLTLTPTEGSVAPGDSATIQLKVKFDEPTGGVFYAVVETGSNDPEQPVVTTPVTLHVIGVPDIHVYPDSLDFGSVEPGYSSTRMLRVANEGGDQLVVSSLSVAGTDFSLDLSPFSLNPGLSKNLELTFSPDLLGTFRDSLTIVSNDPDESPLSVLLKGIGAEVPPGPDTCSVVYNEDGYPIAADSGGCDTVRIGCKIVVPTIVPGDSIAIPLFLWSDAEIAGFALGFSYNSNDVEITSWNLEGSVIPVDVSWAARFRSYPDSNRVLIGWVDLTAETPIPPTAGSAALSLGTLYMRVLPGATRQVIDIDSVFVPPAGRWELATTMVSTIFPQYADCGTADIHLGTCGDADGNLTVDIADAVYLVNYIFDDGPAPVPEPLAAGDVNCDNLISLTDVVYLVNYIFGGGPAPCAGC
jgi:subtilisin family serine protease